MTRRLPALCLFLLAPLIGEVLLGNLPLTSLDTLAAFPVLALLYGAGAVVIREVAVRTGRAWPTMLILAIAYGVLEEGLVTQSLFSPSFNGLALNEYGQLAGIGVPWALFVLTIHSVWSIVVPTVLVESLFPARIGKPWLGIPGLVVAIVLYLLGAAALSFGTIYKEGFVAEPAQLLGAAVVAIVLIIIGFLIRPANRRSYIRTSTPWSPVALGSVAFVAGSLFFTMYRLGVTLRLLLPAIEVLGAIVLIGAVVAIVTVNASRSGWGGRTSPCACLRGSAGLLLGGRLGPDQPIWLPLEHSRDSSHLDRCRDCPSRHGKTAPAPVSPQRRVDPHRAIVTDTVLFAGGLLSLTWRRLV